MSLWCRKHIVDFALNFRSGTHGGASTFLSGCDRWETFEKYRADVVGESDGNGASFGDFATLFGTREIPK